MTAAFIISCIVAGIGRIAWESYDLRTRSANAGNWTYIRKPWMFWARHHYTLRQFILLDVPQGAAVFFFVMVIMEGIGG